LPQLVPFVLWGDYFEEVLYKNASLVFPRAKQIWKVIITFYLKLVLYVGSSILIFALALSSKCILSGNFSIGKTDIMNMVLYILYMIVFLAFINCFALFGKTIIGLLAGLVIQIAGLVFLCKAEMVERKGDFVIPAYVFVLLQGKGVINQQIIEMIYLVSLLIVIFLIECILAKRAEWR
ncbi:MAG: hypothetical protein ACI4EF_01350, partial [Coprococcus sp.]